MERPPTALAIVGLSCVQCRYDLSGTPREGHCPECGFSVRESFLRQVEPRQFGLDHMRSCVSGLAFLALLQAVFAPFDVGILLSAAIGGYEAVQSISFGVAEFGRLCALLLGGAAWIVVLPGLGTRRGCSPWPGLDGFGRRLIRHSLGAVAVGALGAYTSLAAPAGASRVLGSILVTAAIWWMDRALIGFLDALGRRQERMVAPPRVLRRAVDLRAIVMLAVSALLLIDPSARSKVTSGAGTPVPVDSSILLIVLDVSSATLRFVIYFALARYLHQIEEAMPKVLPVSDDELWARGAYDDTNNTGSAPR